jgi:peptidoglycan/xylan/chitin deacetylase (PgdA/CDA1 family)
MSPLGGAARAPRPLAKRVAGTLPEPVSERLRLLLARGLERRLRRSSAVRGAALVFHVVAPRGGDFELEIEPAVARDRLDAAIGYLKDRYALVRAAELPSAARTRNAGERVPIALTFDDDLTSHREHAAPVLARHGTIATAFLCGARSPFWWQLLQIAVDTRAIAPDELPHVAAVTVEHALERRPGAIRQLAKAIEDLAPDDRDYVAAALARAVRADPSILGPDGAAALSEAGWEIGYHTPEHHLLTSLGDRALRAALERQPVGSDGTLPRTLAYPHGKATEREAAAARRAGYEAAFTGYPTPFGEDTDVHLIGRLQPDTATLGRFALQLARALSAA